MGDTSSHSTQILGDRCLDEAKLWLVANGWKRKVQNLDMRTSHSDITHFGCIFRLEQSLCCDGNETLKVWEVYIYLPTIWDIYWDHDRKTSQNSMVMISWRPSEGDANLPLGSIRGPVPIPWFSFDECPKICWWTVPTLRRMSVLATPTWFPIVGVVISPF